MGCGALFPAAFQLDMIFNGTGVMEKKFGISSAVLKWIAVVSMVIDHFACAVYNPAVLGCSLESYRILRGIGRIAFPIYCFLLAEGFFHTRSVWKYLRNLIIFAAISEIPFNMAVFGEVFYLKGQNVYCTLALGLCAMLLLERVSSLCGRVHQVWLIVIQAVIIAVFMLLGEKLEVDYNWEGIASIIMFYYLKKLQLRKDISAMAGAAAFAVYEPPAVFSFIPIYLYNGKRGRHMKYLFYAIYPIHLLLFGLWRFWILGRL